MGLFYVSWKNSAFRWEPSFGHSGMRSWMLHSPARNPVGSIPQASPGHSVYWPFYREGNGGSRRPGPPKKSRSPGHSTMRSWGLGPLRHQLPTPASPPRRAALPPSALLPPHRGFSPLGLSQGHPVPAKSEQLRCGLCGCQGRSTGEEGEQIRPQDPAGPLSIPAAFRASLSS